MARIRRRSSSISAEHQEVAREQAWNDGFEAGRVEGYYEAGHKAGWSEGFDVGHHDGYCQGYQDAKAGRPMRHEPEPHPSQAELSVVQEPEGQEGPC